VRPVCHSGSFEQQTNGEESKDGQQLQDCGGHVQNSYFTLRQRLMV
jgi:hypothetical protein